MPAGPCRRSSPAVQISARATAFPGVVRRPLQGARQVGRFPMFTGTGTSSGRSEAVPPDRESLGREPEGHHHGLSTSGSTSDDIVLAFVSGLGVKADRPGLRGPQQPGRHVWPGRRCGLISAPPFSLQREGDGENPHHRSRRRHVLAHRRPFAFLIVDAKCGDRAEDAGPYGSPEEHRGADQLEVSTPNTVRMCPLTSSRRSWIKASMNRWRTKEAIQTDAMRMSTASCATP